VPPFTLFSVAFIPGAFLVNVAALAGIAFIATALTLLTGDWMQWGAYGLGIYAVFSWVQALRHRDPPAYRLIWGNRFVIMLAVAVGSISFMTYAISFWAPPYAIRAFYGGVATAPAHLLPGRSAAEEVATILGLGAAVAAATGVIMGGVISDLWRRRDPRGRIFVSMLAVILPAPAVWIMLTTDNLGTFYLASPVAQLFGSAWVGAAVASLQDVVLPRMRATAGATYVLGTTMVGLALGPYAAGKMADVTGSLSAGIFSLYIVPPFTLIALWIVSRRIAELEASKVERATAAGEPV
jgi:MFS family permease